VPSGLVIGIGNRLRGDDAAGCLVADALLAGPHPGFDIVCSDGNISSLLDWFGRYSSIALVDAIHRAEATRLLRWDVLAGPLPRPWSCASSHAFGVVEAIELARVLGLLPRRLVAYGVPALDFGFSAPLSKPTRRAVSQTAARIRREWEASPHGAGLPLPGPDKARAELETVLPCRCERFVALRGLDDSQQLATGSGGETSKRLLLDMVGPHQGQQMAAGTLSRGRAKDSMAPDD